MTRQLFLHIGASKTGTSSLQVGIVNSQDALARAGVGVPFARRKRKSRSLLRPLGWENVEGFQNPVDGRALDASVRRIRQSEGDRLLVSSEELCELDDDRIGELVGRIAAAGTEPHVIVTAREWSRQLPSEYQQQLKRRMTKPYEIFLGEVRDREGADAEQFYRRQDVAQMCARWAGHVPADRIHVIPVSSADRDLLFREFSALVGYPREAITKPSHPVNQSFGLVECEVLRRFNLTLGDRLSDIRNEYNPGVRRTLRRVLKRESQLRLTLPPEHLAWVQEAGRRQVRELQQLGVDVRGDAGMLVAGDDSARPMPEIDDAEIARVALESFANFAVQSFNDYRRMQRRIKAAEGK